MIAWLLWPFRFALSTFLIGGVWFYRLVLRPVLPAVCRFEPSCSEYSILAIKRYGLVKGCGLTVWRICRCQPLCKGGVDYP